MRTCWFFTVSGLVLVSLLCVEGLAHADLIHRYSFNNGTANDSVGTANGTIFNGASVSGGQLHMNGTGFGASVQYMQMPANVIPAGSTTTTIEEWFTASAGLTQNARGFDFGLDQTNNFFLNPYSGNSHSRLRITLNGFANETGPDQGPNLNDGIQHMIAGVVDQPNNQISLYLDGSVVQTTALSPNTLSGLIATNNYIGRSQYSADPGFNASVDEFRIFDAALSASTISTHFANGPDDPLAVPEPASLTLLGFAVTGLAAYWRMRKRMRPELGAAISRRSGGAAMLT